MCRKEFLGTTSGREFFIHSCYETNILLIIFGQRAHKTFGTIVTQIFFMAKYFRLYNNSHVKILSKDIK